MVLTLILAESSIELVPAEVRDHPTVLSWARRKGKPPEALILDQNYHHRAILKLGPNGSGRGRPDITHFCLLLALGSPLNMENRLRCYVHTRDDHVISVAARARLPRSSDRFVSLLEQLFQASRVPPSGPSLMTVKPKPLPSLLEELSPDAVIAFTRQGVPMGSEEIAEKLAARGNPAVLVGGFSQGHFSERTLSLVQERRCLDRRGLEAWTVVARLIYDYEEAVGLERF